MAEKLRLSDYSEPAYRTTKTDLTFELFEDHTLVSSTLHLSRNIEKNQNEVVLFGDGQDILSLLVDGKPLSPKDFLKGNDLYLQLNNKEHTIFIKTKIHPQDNKSFEGLYRSNNKYFTQCEAEGFRKITYYQDRPDVLSKFTTTIIASGYPVLLSNGNLVSEESLGDKTKVVWEDPYPKPSYLFALVAGDFDKITDHVITRSKRNVLLEVYVDKGMTSKAKHAMQSLKESMKWDEDRYDLEYDLDRYMIVAANDFNFGAMENKGLNIFNAKYVLADMKSATDTDFYNIQSVVGHEYFHNWTGNRVTCRDWFQLSLKEGLTVYRDQEFSSDLNSRGVKRIDDVIRLRSAQFTEDASSNAHPVRPSEAFNISNFYTATIYEKGAELIRMIEVLIGREAFKSGMAKYFELFDGQAVTTEDFCYAMSEASGRDLAYFQKWYTQKGTPKVEVKKLKGSTLKVEFSQLTSPLLLPMLCGFIDSSGKPIQNAKILHSTCPFQIRGDSILFELEKEKETIELDLPNDTRLSLLRDFSCPITLTFETDIQELYDLAKFDTNSFSKWEAIQQIIVKDILTNISNLKNSKPLDFDKNIVLILKNILSEPISDPAYIAKLLTFPSVDTIKLEFEDSFPIDEIIETLDGFEQYISRELETEMLQVYNDFLNTDTSGARSLKNSVLYFLCLNPSHWPLADQQFQTAKNMTDQLMALQSLKDSNSDIFKRNLKNFYQEWAKDSLVYTKYLSTLYTRKNIQVFEDIKNQNSDPFFSNWNPNHNFASYAALGLHNPFVFHNKSGQGYQILADRIIELDKKNPYVAARLASCFNDYKKLDTTRAALMKPHLERLLQTKLSTNTFEIIHNTAN